MYASRGFGFIEAVEVGTGWEGAAIHLGPPHIHPSGISAPSCQQVTGTTKALSHNQS